MQMMSDDERAEMERLKERQSLLQDELHAFKERLAALEAKVGAAPIGQAATAQGLDATAAAQTQAEPPKSTPAIASSSLAALLAAREARELAVAEAATQHEPPPMPVEVRIVEAVAPEAPSIPPIVAPIHRRLTSEPPPLPPILPPAPETTAAPPLATIDTTFPEPPAWSPANEPVPEQQMAMNEGADEPRVPAGEATAKPSFELRLGTYWLVRIGIVMILTGLVYLGGYAYKNYVGRLGPGGKVALLYLAGGLLLGAGARLQRKQEKDAMRNYGQVVFAGGLATVYFTTYAAHYFENLRVIASGTVDGALLLAWAGFMVWIADRKKSEVFAFFGIGLAYYSSFITQVGTFTLYSNLVLTIASVFFLVRNRWAMLSVGSQLATYAGFAFWRFHHTNGWLWEWDVAQVWTGTWFLASYWIVFTAAVFLSRAGNLIRGARVAFLTLNNVAFFTLVVLSMLYVSRGSFWIFCLGYGSTLLALAGLAKRFLAEDTPARTSYLIQGLLLITVGFISYFAGLNLALVLAAESLVLVLLATQLQNKVLQGGAQIVAAMATGWVLFDLAPFDHSGLWVGSAVGAVMILDSFISRPRDPENALAISWPALFYTVLGLIVWSVTTWDNVHPEWRGLVFAAETAAFLVASRFLRNPVLGYGAYAFAALAVGCHLYLLTPGNSQLLATGTAIGGLMLFNAVWASARRPEASAAHIQFEQIYFSVLAQLIWLATTWNAPGDWRAVIFAGESVSFLLASRFLQLPALEIGGYLTGIGAVGLGVLGTREMDSAGLWRGTIIGGLMLLNALEHRLQRPELGQQRFKLQEPFFTALALMIWLVATWQNTTPAWRGLVLGIEAILFTMAAYPLRLPEIALFGQIFLTAGQADCLWCAVSGQPQLAGWQMVSVLGLSVGLTHWWQRQKGVECIDATRQTWQAIHSLGAVGVLFFWLHPKFTPEAWLAVTSGLAIAVTLYGILTGAWFLAGFGQFFLWASAAGFWLQIYGQSSHPMWSFALAPIVTTFVFARLCSRWINREGLIPDNFHQSLRSVSLVYRCAAFVMTLAWIFQYIHEPDRFWVLVLVGLCFFALSGWRQEREPLYIGLAFELVGFGTFWLDFDKPSVIYLPNLLAVLALLVQQQIARRRPIQFPLSAEVHTVMILLGGCSLWLYCSRLVMIKAGGFTFYLTATWAILALLIFCGGFVMRERMHRWLGLAVLGCALGRVGLVDVWKLETIYRVLSFMALGVVLLVLGFIYNRYQEKIRELL